MISQIHTVAFQGIEAVPVNVQVMAAPGKIGMSIVGLADKAVTESRERVQSALHASGLSMPAKRVTVNLAPADLPKEGSHYDLPVSLCLMAALGAIPSDSLQGFIALGELSLDGTLNRVNGALPAAIAANALGKGVICPTENGEEAAWADEEMNILAPHSLIALANHFRGTQILSRPVARMTHTAKLLPDLNEIRGQETAKRALEIAAAGGHNMLMTGPPGSGKSMLASRLPGILPPLSPKELLEVSMIASISGTLPDGKLSTHRPFRAPHHSASMAAMVGGGRTARPGEVSMAHNGVLFLDELPEFSPKTLDSLRQPLESGETSIARASYRINYPSRFQLVAAMNPCQCGMAGEPGYKCRRGERCASDYQGRISTPFLDRIDICVEVSAMNAEDIIAPKLSESSAQVAQRVLKARKIQQERYANSSVIQKNNATAETRTIEQIVKCDNDGEKLILEAASSMKFSARSYYRVLKVAQTIADLEEKEQVQRIHLAEAISYRILLQRQKNSVEFDMEHFS